MKRNITILLALLLCVSCASIGTAQSYKSTKRYRQSTKNVKKRTKYRRSPTTKRRSTKPPPKKPTAKPAEKTVKQPVKKPVRKTKELSEYDRARLLWLQSVLERGQIRGR